MSLLSNSNLKTSDPEIYQLIEGEKKRQEEGLELIASENYTSKAVMQAQGSELTNKYAEGYPRKRYYGGCGIVDQVEQLAIDRAKKLFKADFVNVQPHSGSQANMASYMALLSPGDKILGMNLSEGGHLTHGSTVNFSGRLYESHFYGLHPETQRIDYDALRDQALKLRPKLIIAGASAYPREIDFSLFRKIADEVDAYLLTDMAHIAGLVAAGIHPDPLVHSDIVTSTTHKTLRGPRGGIILTHEKYAKKINSYIFPGIQGGPLEHVIAAKAVCFGEALEDNFVDYQKQTVKNAQVLSDIFLEQGIDIITKGTDNHLILVDCNSVNLTGKAAEEILENAGITCNKNMIPGDKRSPFVTSGIRIGTPAMTTRGLKTEHITEVGKWISLLLKDPSESNQGNIRSKVTELCRQFPVYV